jgi:hypothetical protein
MGAGVATEHPKYHVGRPGAPRSCVVCPTDGKPDHQLPVLLHISRIKVTIEVPDDLYYRVKAQAALKARTVREVSIELHQRWVGDLPPEGSATTPAEWVDQWIALGAQVTAPLPATGTARDEVRADRGRLDRPVGDQPACLPTLPRPRDPRRPFLP